MENPTNGKKKMPLITRDKFAEHRADGCLGRAPSRQLRRPRSALASWAPRLGHMLPRAERRYSRTAWARGSTCACIPDATAAVELGANALAAGRDIGFAPAAGSPAPTRAAACWATSWACALEQARAASRPSSLRKPLVPKTATRPPEVLTEGVKTVVEQAKENEGVGRPSPRPGCVTPSASGTPLAPAKGRRGRFWGRHLRPALAPGWLTRPGASCCRTGNLATPLGWIPCIPPSPDFRWHPPGHPGGPTQLKALAPRRRPAGPAHRNCRGMPPMTLSLDLGWSLDLPAGQPQPGQGHLG